MVGLRKAGRLQAGWCAGAAVVRNLLGSLPTSIWLLLLPPNISESPTNRDGI